MFYFDTDNFVLNDNSQMYYIQVYSTPSCLLRVNNEAQISLTDGGSDITISPPNTNVGVMLCIEVSK